MHRRARVVRTWATGTLVPRRSEVPSTTGPWPLCPALCTAQARRTPRPADPSRREQVRACHTVAPAGRPRPPRTGEPAVTSRAVPRRTLRRIVSLATRAPSVHNTQPWRWHAAGSTLELFADHSRQLPVSDPAGRNLVLSCGAVLHHVQVVA